MAKSTLLEQGELTEVYYSFGTFANDQRAKFLKAPFDILSLNGEQYVQPLAVGGNDAELKGLFGSGTIAAEQYLGRRDFGFSNLTPIVVGEHEMGTGQDSWKGLHFFDLI